jgi:ribonuclease HI
MNQTKVTSTMVKISDTLCIDIYTDGSCHTQHCIGGWAAILFIGGEKIVLSGKEQDTTHNRMELTAVIKAVEYLMEKNRPPAEIKIYSDSQYVVGLMGRKEKLSALHFETRKGNEIRNADLVKFFLALSESTNLQFVKVKAHQKINDIANYNTEADKLSRKIVREACGAIVVENNSKNIIINPLIL